MVDVLIKRADGLEGGALDPDRCTRSLCMRGGTKLPWLQSNRLIYQVELLGRSCIADSLKRQIVVYVGQILELTIARNTGRSFRSVRYVLDRFGGQIPECLMNRSERSM